MTDGMMDKLQNYYGIAINSNVGNLEEMKKAVAASLFHCASSEKRRLMNTAHPGSFVGMDTSKGKQKEILNNTSTDLVYL